MEPLRLRCPGCDAGLKVPAARAGGSVRCPRCRTLVTCPDGSPGAETGAAPAAPPPPTAPASATPKDPRRLKDDQSEVEDVPRPRRVEEPGQWRFVRIGLMILAAETGLGLIVGAIGYLVGNLFSGNLDDARRLMSLLLPFKLQLGSTLVWGLVSLIGYGLCFFTPTRYAPRPLLVAAVGLKILIGLITIIEFAYVMSLAPPVINDLMSAQPRNQATVRGQNADAQKQMEDLQKQLEAIQEWQDKLYRLELWLIPVRLLGIIEAFLFPIFLRQLAQSLKDRESADRCETLLKLIAGLLLGYMMYSIVSATAPLVAVSLFFLLVRLLGLVFFLLSAGQAAMFIMVCVRLQATIKRHVREIRFRRRKERAAD